MSRIRSVHPGFFRDDQLVPCSAFARLLFIGLGVEADDKGIFEWKPVTIKMSVFPGDNVDIGALLSELLEADAVRQFTVSGKRYGAIRNFRKYQKPKTPNDIYPMADGIAEYVFLLPKGEIEPVEQDQFPPNGENHFQMEDGGGKREEEKEKSPPSPLPGEGRAMFDEFLKAYPLSKHSNQTKAERIWFKLTPAEWPIALSQARITRATVEADRQKRSRSAVEHGEFVQGMDAWLRAGAWRNAPPPVSAVPTTRLDRERDADLWRKCERIMGKPAPTADMTWAFLNTVIEQARSAA